MLGLTAKTRVFVKTGAAGLRLAFEGLRSVVVNVIRREAHQVAFSPSAT